MSVSVADPVSCPARPRSQRGVAVARAAAAALWAVAYLAVLHGQRVLPGSGIPLAAGLLLSAYPVIDVVASLAEGRRPGSARAGLRAGVGADAAAVTALLVATLSLHTQAVLIAFGAWALVSGLLQLAGAWRAGRTRRAQLPLILSGAISAVAGLFIAATAGQPVAPLPYPGGYAILGAVFFLAWTYLNRKSAR